MTRIIRGIKKHGISGCCRYAWPFIRGFVKRCICNLRIVIAKLNTDECYIVKEIQGSKMLLNLGDIGISQELFFTSVHEAESTKQTLEEIKTGMTVLEIGANIGYYALIEARLVGEKGKIIAFEPSPINMAAFKANVVLNNYDDRIETHNLGIGSTVGKFKTPLLGRRRLI